MIKPKTKEQLAKIAEREKYEDIKRTLKLEMLQLRVDKLKRLKEPKYFAAELKEQEPDHLLHWLLAANLLLQLILFFIK